ncbi:hypothetical protein chiPu_0005458 [Chiloscyllium punctatum]|uniref:Uncharacterized protein n=1 Tax=Chiloscyllium punctatum TaxID=137246 RepID=A0A401S9G0_CHIPU|nr:hypothetical protein [Chiloscyllium punctatum]
MTTPRSAGVWPRGSDVIAHRRVREIRESSGGRWDLECVQLYRGPVSQAGMSATRRAAGPAGKAILSRVRERETV